MTGASKPTALRDLSDLLEHGVLVLGKSQGRSTNYLLKV
jgi:Fic family protein